MSFLPPDRPAIDLRRALCSIFGVLLSTLLSGAVLAQQGVLVRSASGVVPPPRAADGELPAAKQRTAGWSLEAALTTALRENPEILSTTARLEASAERPSQVRSLADPVLTGTYRNVGFDSFTLGEEMMSVAGIRFTQPMPYRGKRDLLAAAAERSVDVAASRLDVVSRRIVREVAEVYFELAYVHQATDIVADTRDYLLNLEQTAEARYAVGEGIQQDVLKAQVETSILINRLILLEEQQDRNETRLNRLLDRPADASVEVPAGVTPPFWDFPIDELATEAVASSAFVVESTRRVEEGRAALDLARTAHKPDWVLSGAWMNRGSLPDIWEVNVGVTLPFFKGGKQDRAVAEATANIRADELDVRDTSGIVSATVREQLLRAERAWRLVDLYGEVIIPQATLSLESAAAGYEVGRVDFLTVLDNVVTLLTYQLEYYRQSTDYLQALARIEEHLGRSLGVTPASVLSRISSPAAPLDNSRSIPGGDR